MTDHLTHTVAVIGLGLIGGSLAMALRERHLVDRVIGFDKSADARAEAVKLGVIDAATGSIAELVKKADLIVLAVPVMSVEPILVAIRDQLWTDGELNHANLVITDVGSVKMHICSVAERVFGEIPPCLLPSHPIAGSEQHGVAAARSDLFADHKVIVTPHANTSPDAQLLVTRFWEALGAEILIMAPEHHDQVLAGTSHLPHLLAYTLVDTLASGGDRLEVFKYAAGGFRDFTRIAASDPTMWRDIFDSNGSAVLAILDVYMADLALMRDAIAQGDTSRLMETFSRAKVARDYFASLQSNKPSNKP